MSKRRERRKKNRQKVTKREPVDFFDKHYKRLAFIPIILLILAIGQIGIQTVTTGDFINKGVSLAGGTSITIDVPLPVDELGPHLREVFPQDDLSVREIANTGTQIGVIVETTLVDQDETNRIIDEISNQFENLEQKDYAVEVIGPSLGQAFFTQTFTALIFAFILMAGVVFIFFRSIVPSLSVVLAALTDIVVTAAVINVLGIQLSTAGVAAFLMLIGYAVDTNILLSNKMMKGKGLLYNRFKEAFKTGSFMTATTLVAILAALIFTQSDVIRQITLIVFIGLLVDFLSTWLQNAGILRYYLERMGEDEDE